MVIYSIKDIEEITGVKAHTLRIWEKRYDIIKPERTKTNIRYYTEEHLKYILNLTFLNNNGYKISQIAGMTDVEMKEHTSRLSNTTGETLEDQLDLLTIGVINMDDNTVNFVLDKYIEEHGFAKTMDLLINPFLEKLSAFWISGTIKSVHEGFISEILRQKTAVELQKLKQPDSKQKKIMLYLGKDEPQALSLIFLQYLLRSKGLNAVLVGFDLTIKDVLDAYQIINPDYIYTIINQEVKDHSLDTYINYISKSIKESTFIISGYLISSAKMNLPDNCESINEMDKIVDFFMNAVTP